MPKKSKNGESFVTQSQWAEGMEMIKDFFGKLYSELQNTNIRLGKVEDSLGEVKSDLEEVKREVSSNTDSLGMLTKELQEVKHVEFQVYNHEERIKKLEQAR